MKCTDFRMSLVLENVKKVENFQIFHCMQSFHDIHTVFLYCDEEQVFCTFLQNSLYEGRIGNMHTNMHQNRIFHMEKRERLIMFSFWEIQWVPPVKIGILGLRVQGTVMLF